MLEHFVTIDCIMDDCPYSDYVDIATKATLEGSESVFDLTNHEEV